MRLALLLSMLGAAEPARPVEPVHEATIRIDAGEPAGPISPLLYGQFVEFMFEGIKRGLHAELVRDRGFEGAADASGLPRDWMRYPDDRNDDYGLGLSSAPGDPYGELEPGDGEVGGRSLRVDARRGVIGRRGVFQPRLALRAGVGYVGRVWARADGYEGQVVVALEPDLDGARPYAAATFEPVAGRWEPAEFRLKADRDDPHARLVLLFPGSGVLWVDQVSLVPADAVEGVRRDVFERIAPLRPATIRWPGGNVAQDYHWEWGVGPRDARPGWTNLAWRDETEPGDFGTLEFVRFCRAVGAEPTITVNVEGRGATAAEAAAWVEYCNGSADSPGGARRAADGHPEPLGVKFWEVGNEVWGEHVRGHTDAPTYAENYLRYREAMLAVDPAIELIGVGDNDPDWNRAVLARAGDRMDYLAIHHYADGPRGRLMGRPLEIERFYDETAALIAEVCPGSPVKLAINEWGLNLPDRRQYSIESALYGARLMNVFERSDGLVAMSAVSDLVNGWPGGIIQAGRTGVFVTPIYLVNRLYAEHLGSERLAAEVEGPRVGPDLDGPGEPVLDVAASRSADGRHLFIKAVNTSDAAALRAEIELVGARPAPRATLARIEAERPDAFNSFATPDAVRITRSEIGAGPRLAVELPASSVSVIDVELEAPDPADRAPEQKDPR